MHEKPLKIGIFVIAYNAVDHLIKTILPALGAGKTVLASLFNLGQYHGERIVDVFGAGVSCQAHESVRRCQAAASSAGCKQHAVARLHGLEQPRIHHRHRNA